MSVSLDDFIQILGNTLNNDPEVRDPASDYIMEVRKQDSFGLLRIFLGVLVCDCDIRIKNIALVNALTTLHHLRNELDDTTITIKFNELGEDFISRYLEILTTLFSTVPNNAGSLFGLIASVIYEQVPDLITDLCLKMESYDDQDFLLGGFYAISYVCSSYDLRPEQYRPILTRIFKLMGEDISIDLKKMLLKTLDGLVPDIEEVLTDPNNCSTFYDAIMYGLGVEELKQNAYLILKTCVLHHYATLTNYIDELITYALNDLMNESLSEDIRIQVIKFFKQIAKYERPTTMEQEDVHLDITTKVFPTLFEILLNVLNNNYDEAINTSDDATFFEESLAPIKRALISQNQVAYQIINSWTLQYLQDLNALASMGSAVIELVGVFLNYLLHYNSEDEQLTNYAKQYFITFLGCSLPRVSAMAIKIMSSFAIIEGLSQHTLEVFPYVKSYFMSLESLDIGLGRAICDCFVDFIYKKIINSSMPEYQELFNFILKFTTNNDPDFSYFVFEIIYIMIYQSNGTGIDESVPFVFDQFQQSFLDTPFHVNHSNFYSVFGALCQSYPKFVDPYIPQVFGLIHAEYTQNQTIDPYAAETLRRIIEISHNKYSEFVAPIIEILMNILGQTHSSQAVNYASIAIKQLVINLGDNETMLPYISSIYQVINECMGVVQEDIVKLSNYLKPLQSFVYSFFDESVPYIITTIRIIGYVVSNVIDKATIPDEILVFVYDSILFLIRVFEKVDINTRSQWLEMCYLLLLKTVRLIVEEFGELKEEKRTTLIQCLPLFFSHLLETDRESFIEIIKDEIMIQLFNYTNADESEFRHSYLHLLKSTNDEEIIEAYVRPFQ